MATKIELTNEEKTKLQHLIKLIRAKCETSEFVRSKDSYYAKDGDPSIDQSSDYSLKFSLFRDIQELKQAFKCYGMLRSVYIYEDLIFVNVLIDGWEAWTLKYFGDNELDEIDTISIRRVITEGTEVNGKHMTFEEYIKYLSGLSEKQVLLYMQREVTPKELADLPEEWENPTVDTSKYYQCVLHAWEVREEFYLKWKTAGGLCQKHNGKFYIA